MKINRELLTFHIKVPLKEYFLFVQLLKRKANKMLNVVYIHLNLCFQLDAKAKSSSAKEKNEVGSALVVIQISSSLLAFN